MTTSRFFVIAVIMLAVGIGVKAGQDPQTPIVPSGEGLPDAPGKDAVVKVCGICHQANRAASVRLTAEGWTETIDDMVRRGAKGTEAELKQVYDYLTTNFLGEAPRPLNVNSANQIDLESVAGLLRKEAAAVIQYRTKHGPFKTLDEMKKVPGLDFKKIDSRRDRLVAF